MSEVPAPNPPPLAPFRRSGPYWVLLAALAGLVLWQSASAYLQWKQRLEELVAIAETHGVADRRPGIVAGMRRDAGSTRAAMRLARAILADELDRRWTLDLPPDEREEERRRGRDRLDVAHRLGIDSLGERPASWEALLVIGGAEYLRLARRPQRGELVERARWLEPLEEAHRLAPRQPEPLRFLAAADLGNWSVLSDDERQRAISRLETAFQDPTTFDLLSAAWLRVAPSLGQALAIVPETTWAWSGLMKHFARRGDWERHCDARDRWRGTLRAFSNARLDEAVSRLRWGDSDKGIQRLLWVGANTPPDAANLELIERVLTVFPPGAAGEAGQRWLRPWLDWALERCAQADGCRMSRPSLQRLVSLNRELPAATRARALAASGALRAAETAERQYRREHGELSASWAPYATSMAGPLVRRGEAEDALALLRETGPPGRDATAYWLAYESAAKAADAEDDRALAAAWLESEARTRWRPSDWTTTGRLSRLDIWPREASPGLELRLEVAGGDRGFVEIVWDGSVVETTPAVDGSVLELAHPVSRDVHALEIRAHEGAGRATAAVRLLPLAP